MTAPRHDLDAIRREHSLVSLVAQSVKLRRSGRGWSGLCPFHQEKTASFTVSDEKGFYHCFGCGAHGDLFDWIAETQGCTFREAIEQLAAGRVAPARDIAQREGNARADHSMVGSATVGRFIWGTAGPARGEIVEAWLDSRGLRLDGFAAGDGIDRLKFHPRCPVVPWRVHEDPLDAWLTAPAMVAGISDSEGGVWGVHVTYLAPDGRDKARLPRTKGGEERPSRKIWGRVAGLACWLTEPFSAGSGPPPPASPVPLPVPGRNGPLVVGEGIETVWAWCQQQPGHYRAAAALSLGNLGGAAKRLAGGALPLWRPEWDADKSVFTLPDPGEVIVLVDADMKPLRDQRVQRARGEAPVRADISPLERAQLCAATATQAWRAAGATKVTAVRPRLGMDFNDVAMEVAA